MDYVSTAQRPVRIKDGRKVPPSIMSTRRFHEMLRLAGFCEDAAWPDHISEEDIDRAIDEDLSEVGCQPRSNSNNSVLNQLPRYHSTEPTNTHGLSFMALEILLTPVVSGRFCCVTVPSQAKDYSLVRAPQDLDGGY